MYGGYGGYGNYNGYGSYSSYGGYSGYNSNLGGYGSGYSANRITPLTTGIQNLEQNINDPNQLPKQQQNQRKHVIQQYYKMMGGLRSMVELGFALVALCNFGSKTWQLLKKILQFLGNTTQKIFLKISESTIISQKMSKIFEKAMMISPNSKNGNTLINKIYFTLRIFSILILLITIKLKTNLKNQIQHQHDQIIKSYQDIKLQQQKISQKQTIDSQQLNTYQKQGFF